VQRYPSDWNRRRKRVYQRDNYTCQMCGLRGGPYGNTELHAHHQVPISRGGGHQLSNLVTLCKTCHMDVVHGDGLPPSVEADRMLEVFGLIAEINEQTVYQPDEDSVTIEDLSQFSQSRENHLKIHYVKCADDIINLIEENNQNRIEEVITSIGQLSANPHSPPGVISKSKARSQYAELSETVERLCELHSQMTAVSSSMSETYVECKTFERRTRNYIEILAKTATATYTIIESESYDERSESLANLYRYRDNFLEQNRKWLRFDELKDVFYEEMESAATGSSIDQIRMSNASADDEIPQSKHEETSGWVTVIKFVVAVLVMYGFLLLIEYLFLNIPNWVFMFIHTTSVTLMLP